MFKDIEKNEGREKVESIFKWRKNRLLKDIKDILSDKKTFREKVFGFKDFLESNSYFVDLSETNGHYTLSQFNCPIYRLASEYREACRYELQMYRDIFGKEVNREGCIADGNPSCIYNIPKNSPKI